MGGSPPQKGSWLGHPLPWLTDGGQFRTWTCPVSEAGGEKGKEKPIVINLPTGSAVPGPHSCTLPSRVRNPAGGRAYGRITTIPAPPPAACSTYVHGEHPRMFGVYGVTEHIFPHRFRRR